MECMIELDMISTCFQAIIATGYATDSLFGRLQLHGCFLAFCVAVYVAVCCASLVVSGFWPQVVNRQVEQLIKLINDNFRKELIN